jgi:hypothetical protein
LFLKYDLSNGHGESRKLEDDDDDDMEAVLG